jgi:hypothetical protein
MKKQRWGEYKGHSQNKLKVVFGRYTTIFNVQHKVTAVIKSNQSRIYLAEIFGSEIPDVVVPIFDNLAIRQEKTSISNLVLRWQVKPENST